MDVQHHATGLRPLNFCPFPLFHFGISSRRLQWIVVGTNIGCARTQYIRPTLTVILENRNPNDDTDDYEGGFNIDT